MIPAARIQQLGPYKMGERLGIGGMAEVFSAESARFGQIALKRILPGLAQDADFADMFWDEARMTSRLNHPNIVRILDYGRIDGQLYMALEYVGGPTLARVLRKAARVKTPLGLSVLLGIVVDLLDALHYVHTARDERGTALGIIHRDVSPGNVMLTGEGEVKLADFGIIRSEAVMRRTQPGELKGKMGYMSPEQALGGTVTARSDLFRVGIILAEFLTLRPLFLGKNEMHTLSRTVAVDLATWHRYKESIPQELQAIVERALHLR
jgi:serine/threonine-protein kinase